MNYVLKSTGAGKLIQMIKTRSNIRNRIMLYFYETAYLQMSLVSHERVLFVSGFLKI